jgi:hypothetical protein
MLMKIWKYQFEGPSMCWQMPQGAEILTAQYQGGIICLWARVDPDKSKEPRRFQIYGTGHEISAGPILRYVATVQTSGELLPSLVWHIFEVMRDPL